jgi:hypothetical protein
MDLLFAIFYILTCVYSAKTSTNDLVVQIRKLRVVEEWEFRLNGINVGEKFNEMDDLEMNWRLWVCEFLIMEELRRGDLPKLNGMKILLQIFKPFWFFIRIILFFKINGTEKKKRLCYQRHRAKKRKRANATNNHRRQEGWIPCMVMGELKLNHVFLPISS